MPPDGQATSLLRRVGPWLGVVGLALGLRLVYVNQIRTIPFFDTLVGDAAAYDAWAQRIAGGDWVGDEPFYQAPAYPYFLAVLYRAMGRDLLGVRIVQAFLGSLACLFLALAGARFFNRSVGMTAGVLLAVYPPAIFFDGLLQKTSLGLLLMTALLWRLGALGGTKRRALAEWLIVGLLLGLFGLTRENALVLIAVVLGWMWLGFRTCPMRVRLARVGGLVVGLGLTLGVTAWRNHHVGGVWAITTVQAGPNFYIGNHDGATGRYTPLVRGHESPPFEQADAKRLAEEATGRSLTDAEVSRYWLSRAWQFIRAKPGAWVKLLGAKLLLALNAYEITDTEGYAVYRTYSVLLGSLGALLHFGVVAPLAAAGVVLTWPGRGRLAQRGRSRAAVIAARPLPYGRGSDRWRAGGCGDLALLHAMAVALLVTIVAFYVFARYRFPLAPIAVLFAAAGLVEGLRRWRDDAQPGLARPALALIAASVVCNLPVNPVRQLDAMAFGNLGGVLAQQGNFEGATQVFQIAIEENPHSPELHYNLGLAYRMRGLIAQAVAAFNRAKELSPDLIEVDYQLGAAYEALGEAERALGHYREALRIDPDDAEAEAGVARLAGRE